MGSWHSTHAKLLFAVPVLLITIVVVLLMVRPSSPSSSGRAGHSQSPTTIASSPSYFPMRVTPPDKAIERTVNQQLAAEWTGESLATAVALPSAATCATFPPVDAADSSSPSSYAGAFTQELLDIDFATSTRVKLLAWASFNNAPNSLASEPASINLKTLPASLTTGSAPVPPGSEWRRLGETRTHWRVSGLVVSVSPEWTELLGTGWQPIDPLMVMYDVSGTLAVSIPDHAPTLESIFFVLTLGGASLHPGYGAVAVNDWTVN